MATRWSSQTLQRLALELLALDKNTTADVCVVGAGLTTAYLSASEGDPSWSWTMEPIAGGKTSRTTAHLVSALDDRYAGT